MKRIILAVVALAALALSAHAQLIYGPAASSTSSFTITVTGSGTGSVTDTTGQISSCTSAGGPNCSGTYTTGANVSITVTPTGGSTINMTSGTDGASVCIGSSPTCAFTITANATLTVILLGSGSTGIPASPNFSIDINSTTFLPFGGTCSGSYANCISAGQLRFWDTPNINTPFLVSCTNGTNTCPANGITYNFAAAFDPLLLSMNANSVKTAQMDLARTPIFATSDSNPVDGPNCNYYSAGSTAQAKQPGQCYPPTDVNSDGTGTDLYFRNIWAKIIAHANGKDGNAGYLSNHAHIAYWETWNEPSFAKFWRGTYAELIRFQADTYALVKGYSGFALTFTAVNNSGLYTIASNPLAANNNLKGYHYNVSGFTNGTNNKTNVVVLSSTSTTVQLCDLSAGPSCNNTITATETHAGTGTFVNPFTGETDAQVQATVTSGSFSYPLDSTAQVVMPPYFGEGAGLAGLAPFMYCTGTAPNCGLSTQPTSLWPGGHLLTDAINFHGKPGNDNPTLPESVIATWVSNISGNLSAIDNAKPYYNTESGYSGCGWAPTAGCQPSNTPDFTIANNQAAFMIRNYVWSWFKGVTNTVWYNHSVTQGGLGTVGANVAYTSAFNWMVGSTGLNCTNVSTLQTCTLTKADGVAAQIMWDTALPCTTTTCLTTLQSVPIGMLHYFLSNDPNQVSNNVSAHQVPVGFVPVFVQAE